MKANDFLLYLLLSLVYATPLVAVWLCYRVSTRLRWRVFDVIFIVWCLSFFALLHGVTVPLAPKLLPIASRSLDGFHGWFDWPQTLIAPGIQGFITALLLWHGTNNRGVFTATIAATVIACVIVRSLQWYAELPAALLWNAIVSTSILSAARSASDRQIAPNSAAVPNSNANAPNATAKP